MSIDGSFKDKHLWVKKATGLGVTEFMLRIMAWLCTNRSEIPRNGSSQMCIVTGPNIDIAIKLIRRLKNIFELKLGLVFDNKETILELNGCAIEAYPSNHIDSFRALENPKFILIDEGDFFRKSEQDDGRHVTERYIGKSDPFIVMISTPNAPDGLFERIEKEPEETCLYKRLKMDYSYGLGKIYTKEDIEKAKQSPGFEREYCLKYLGKIGNLFSPLQVDRVVQLGQQFSEDRYPINPYALHFLGIDPGFGSSKTAIVLTELIKEHDKIRVIYAEEFERPNPSEITDLVFDIYRKHFNTWIIVDGSNAGFCTELKIKFSESTDYLSGDINPEIMKVLPVNFNTEHKQMLSHLHMLVNKEYLAVPEKFDKLIVGLRTAWAKEYLLDKEQTSYSDSIDALRLSLKGYKIS